jgi:hypothetical protein
VNERWQSYWVRLFGDRGFVVVDAIGPPRMGESEAGLALRAEHVPSLAKLS